MIVETTIALDWSEIELAPEKPGVYAWYSKMVISKADIEDVITRTNNAKTHSDQKARDEISQALDRFIFGPFRESPYRVQLRGQLKPSYSGEIEHDPSKSDSLIARLVQNPERFRVIASVLKTAAPSFTAPLYIGMSDNLRSRLKRHKSLIVELRDTQAVSAGSALEPLDAGFAKQVVARKFDPTNLFVHIAEVDVESGEENDIENILNRINYPIFGRN
jgi:hypothetical protein